MSSKNPKKKKTVPKLRKSSVEMFRKNADQLAQGASAFEAALADPMPEWAEKMVVQFTRIVAPDVVKAAKKRDDEMMFGHLVAAELEALGALKEHRVTQRLKKEKTPLAKFVREQLETWATPEAERINKTLKAATELPWEHSKSFFKAYSNGLEKGAAGEIVERMESSTTAGICAFVIMARPWIEKGIFRNITHLAETYLKSLEAFGCMQVEKAAVKASIMAQFRKICSQAGLKISARGRPRKNRTGELANQ